MSTDLVQIITSDAATVQSFRDIYGEAAESRLRQEAGFLPSIIANNPVIGRCGANSIKFALVQVAILGLSIMPSRKQAYLVPYGSKCQLLLGYKGKIDLLAKAGVINSAAAGAVRKNDKFSHQETESGFKYQFEKALSNRGPIIGAFCCLTLPSGKTHGKFITLDEINKRRAIAKSGKFWNAWDDEMSAKTAVHMTISTMPSNVVIDKINTVDEWIYDLGNAQVEIEEDRLAELREMFSVQDKGLRQSVYYQLPQHERDSEKVKSIYKEVNQSMKAKTLEA